MGKSLGVFFLLLMILSGVLQYQYDSRVDYFAHKKFFLLLPSSQALKILSFGYQNILADLLYIWSIQFYSTYHIDNRFDYIEHIYNLITDINPQFRAPYYIGSLIMALEAKEVEMAIRLLQKGSKHIKDEWFFDFESAYYAFKFLKDYKLAEFFYRKAAENPEAPSVVKRKRAHMIYMMDDLITSYKLWLEILNEADTQLGKDAAVNHLSQIKFEIDKKMLEEKISLFKKKFHRYPFNLAELKSEGFVKEIPRDYKGRAYIYNSKEGTIKAIRIFRWKKFL